MNSEKVLSFFKEITKIPRESGHEEHIIAYLQEFASERSLECKTDKAGNVLIMTLAKISGIRYNHKVFPLAGDDGILRRLHLQEFSIRDFQEIGQGQLFIDAVRSVKAVTIGAHDTGDAPG